MCNPGFFGDECKHSCSEYCIGMCNHLDGTCSCKEGYTGKTCDEGEGYLKQLLYTSTSIYTWGFRDNIIKFMDHLLNSP